MKLILKLIAAPFIVLLTVLVAVFLFLFSVSLSPDGGLGHYAPVGRGAVLHQSPGVRRRLSVDCVPAFSLRLAGGGWRCHYGAEWLKPVSAAIHHKLIVSGQVVPK